ncbi:MAG: T9SS type A sorting domain-containing protein [Saprospiraceae bacterium]|nr:T9SS type A sorting domain-containing protein [Saprospiraceae bacterium]
MKNFNLIHCLANKNPTHSGEIIIYSSLPKTEYEILDVHGKRILLDSFTGKEHRQSLQVPSGLYFLKYRDMIGHGSVLKIIKQ